MAKNQKSHKLSLGQNSNKVNIQSSFSNRGKRGNDSGKVFSILYSFNIHFNFVKLNSYIKNGKRMKIRKNQRESDQNLKLSLKVTIKGKKKEMMVNIIIIISIQLIKSIIKLKKGINIL